MIIMAEKPGKYGCGSTHIGDLAGVFDQNY